MPGFRRDDPQGMVALPVASAPWRTRVNYN
jgi:hypothetical protein